MEGFTLYKPLTEDAGLTLAGVDVLLGVYAFSVGVLIFFVEVLDPG